MRAFGEEQRFAAQTYVAVGPDGLDPCDLRPRERRRRRAAHDRLEEADVRVHDQAGRRRSTTSTRSRVGSRRCGRPRPSSRDIRDPASQNRATPANSHGCSGVELSEVTCGPCRLLVRAARRRERNRAPAAAGTIERPARRGGCALRSDRAPPAIDGPSLVTLPTDHATRLERDALMAMLQYPSDGGDRPDAAGPPRRPSRIRASLSSATASRPRLDTIDSTRTGSPGSPRRCPRRSRPLVTELGVAPIPERSRRRSDRVRARSSTSALIERDLLREKADLLAAAPAPARRSRAARGAIDSERRAARRLVADRSGQAQAARRIIAST